MSLNNPCDISIIIPVYNEDLSVANVHASVLTVLSRLNKDFEIIFVDDASTDSTLAILKQLSPIIIVCLENHRGQSCAMDAGIKQSTGKIIVTLDGDGQNDPQDIPAMLVKMDEGYDAVCGWRHQRKDPWDKILIAQGASLLRKILIKDGIHDAGCALRAYRKECFKDFDLSGGLHRMIPGILCGKNFKITEIKVNHHPRIHGKTKYGLKRIFEGLRDMMAIWFWRKNPNNPIYRDTVVKYNIKEIIKKAT